MKNEKSIRLRDLHAELKILRRMATYTAKTDPERAAVLRGRAELVKSQIECVKNSGLIDLNSKPFAL